MRMLQILLSFCFVCFYTILFAQKQERFQVTGKVIDETQKPVVATILLNKTSQGVVTDSLGNFRLQANLGDSITISSVGYANEVVVINKASKNLQIILASSSGQLNDVVVTALGIKREKREVGYATQSVQGASLQKAPETNVASNLVGKVAGLSVYTKSTLFENPEVYLRGESALVVIDGVPSQTDFWNINPNDIDNVTVLKGTAASALYGSLGITALS